MKLYALMGMGALVIGGLVLSGEKVSYQATEALNASTTAPAVVSPEYPEEWLKEAEEAKQAVLERLEKEARIAELETEISVRIAEKEQLEKEVGSY